MERPTDPGVSALIRQMAQAEAAQKSGRPEAVAEHSPEFSHLPPPTLPEIPFRHLIDRLPILVFELAPDGTVLFTNPVVTSVTGFRPEELLGENWWTVFCPGEWSRRAAEVRQLMQAGDIAGKELVLLAKSGRPVYLEVTSSNAYGPEGLQRIVGFGVDVSRRREAEEGWKAGRHTLEQRIRERTAELQRALEGAEQRAREAEAERSERKLADAERERLLNELDSTITSIADGVLLFGPAGEMLRLNPAARNLFGPGAEELARLPETGADFRLEAPDGHLLPRENWPLRRALAGEPVQGQIVLMQVPENPPKWLSVSAAPLRRPDGVSCGAVMTVSEITPLRALQEQQEIYLHTISHDLRVPLTILSGHTELLEDLLRRGGLEKEALSSIEAMHQGIERMNAMIGDLVDVARLQGGELVMQTESVELGDFTDRLMRQSGIAMDVGRICNEISRALPPVSADKERLARILINLLSNALKYSPPGAPVWIRADETGDHIVVSVIDQGQGIAAGDLPRIFERFYRLQGKRRVDGLGLGLYITKMLVEAHGGCIWVKSREGEGSTFFFSLPKAENE